METHLHSLQFSWDRVQLLCLKQGVSMQELAKATGLSRTTLNNWAHGKTGKPHAQKITLLASALNVPVEELLHQEPAAKTHVAPEPMNSVNIADEMHNPAVKVVVDERPELFKNWVSADWDELYSEFGVGGGLSQHGVLTSADKINRKKETFRKLELVLESDLAELMQTMVDSFYQKIQAHSPLLDKKP